MTREEILDEIRRTAANNGGRPLGRERFELLTGITEYDVGRYWPRWNVAVHEAGFEPNKMTTALDDAFLIEKYVGLVRKLNGAPTAQEMRLERAKSDAGFPTAKTYRRFGSKNDLIGKVLDYCRERPDDEDVVQLLESVHVWSIDNADADPAAPAGVDRYGFVYCLQGRRGEFKIGRTERSTISRLAELDTGSSVPLAFIWEIRTDDPLGVEAYWHRRFASRRMDRKREWFRLTADHVRALKRWRRIS